MSEESKRIYRSAKTLNDVAKVPALIAAPSMQNYKAAITVRAEKELSHLVLLNESAPGIFFDNQTKKALMDGKSLNALNLDKVTTTDISKTDTTILLVIYSTILNEYGNRMLKGIVDGSISSNTIISLPIKIYIPELMRQMGMENSRNRKHVEAVIQKITDYQRMIGLFVYKNGTQKYVDRYPVITWLGTSERDNTITFTAPYLNILIYNMLNDAIQRNKSGYPALKKNGQPRLNVSHSYLMKTSIAKERSTPAVEIVQTICQLLEEAGSKNTAHISAATILKRCPVLQYRIENCTDAAGRPDVKHRNQTLRRAFTKAFELLHTQTRIEEEYKDIRIPKPVIPTMQTLEATIYEFPHNGKFLAKVPADPENLKCGKLGPECGKVSPKCGELGPECGKLGPEKVKLPYNSDTCERLDGSNNLII